MLTPRDNFGPDAIALPRRNIVAPPAGKAPPKASRTGGVFDATAACRDGVTVGDDLPTAVAAEANARARAERVVRVLAVVLAAATVVLLLVSPGSHEATRTQPGARPGKASPAQTRGRRARPEATRKVTAGKPASRRRRRRAARPRPRQAPRHRVAPPTRRPAAPSPTPVAPARRVAPKPRPASPLPAPVPAGSPPEFL